MLKESNFVMNYVFTLETWYSFSSCDVKNPYLLEVPHRSWSDKLLSSSAVFAFSQRRGCIICFPATESSIYFRSSSSAGVLRRSPPTGWGVFAVCSVSVVAHYRELFWSDKRKFKIILDAFSIFMLISVALLVKWAISRAKLPPASLSV